MVNIPLNACAVMTCILVLITLYSLMYENGNYVTRALAFKLHVQLSRNV